MMKRSIEPSRLAAVLRASVCAALGFALVPQAIAAISADERQVLLDLYASTNGDHWLVSDGWNGAAGTECHWIGVTCDAAETYVRGIVFAGPSGVGNNLVGTLPSSLSTLTHLEQLVLPSNHLTGPMPSLQAMPALYYVDISNNALSGPFPDFHGLSHLWGVAAAKNQFTGSLPPMTGLDSLVAFSAGRNQLTGPIPDLSGAPNLEGFEVTDNHLSGSIPSLAALHVLGQFYVGSNWLTGPLPPLGNTTAFITLSFNLLSGEIPPQYASVTSLDASNNRLSGPIPALPAATGALVLRNNLLEGSLPSLETPLQPFVLWVDNNQLSGTIPPIADAKLLSLSIGDNEFSGTLPTPPPIFGGGDITLCPNNLDPVPDARWDMFLGHPWYEGCESGSHQNLNQPGIGGTWYNPATGGQGVVFSAFPYTDAASGLRTHTTLFGGWFTYAIEQSDAPDGQTWYALQGDVDDTTTEAMLGLYESMGGVFDSPPAVPAVAVGTVAMTFDDCTHATMRYHFDDGRVDDGVIPLVRLVPSTTCTHSGKSTGPIASAIDSGTFYEPAQSGQGFIVDVDATTNRLFAAWYTFGIGANADNRRWFSLQASIAPGATEMHDVPIYVTTGGAFDAGDPATTSAVGTADLSFAHCGALTMSYRFDAGENAGHSGTRTLQRAGPGILCP